MFIPGGLSMFIPAGCLMFIPGGRSMFMGAGRSMFMGEGLSMLIGVGRSIGGGGLSMSTLTSFPGSLAAAFASDRFTFARSPDHRSCERGLFFKKAFYSPCSLPSVPSLVWSTSENREWRTAPFESTTVSLLISCCSFLWSTCFRSWLSLLSCSSLSALSARL